MPRKKDEAKPLFGLKHDFYASLDNAAQQGIMLIEAVETVLQHAGDKVPAADMLRERVKAFRAALMSDEE